MPGVLQPKRRWILAKLRRYSEAQASPAGRRLESGDTVPYLCRALKVARAGGPEGAVSVKLQPGRLVVSPGRRGTSLSLIVEAWYRLQAMMAPEPVVDYVIVHELAHLKEMNHTRRFWELVGRYCPRWRQHRKWLKVHEAELAARLP